MAGARHVVETQLEQDNVKGTLTGEGRMRIRLNKGETVEQVKENLEKSGINVEMKSVNAGRRPIVSQKQLIEMRVIASEVRKMFPRSAKMRKQADMKGSPHRF